MIIKWLTSKPNLCFWSYLEHEKEFFLRFRSTEKWAKKFEAWVMVVVVMILAEEVMDDGGGGDDFTLI